MLISILAFLAIFYVAWNVGANNASNVMGIPVGSGALSLTSAAVLVFALEVAGVVFYGSGVARTVGVDILGSFGLSMVHAIMILFVVGAFMTAGSYFRLPVSMIQVLVGSIAGYGFAVSSFVDFDVLAEIALSWLFSPVLGVFLGITGYFLVRKYFLSGLVNMHEVGKSFGFFAGLEVVSSALVVFAQGANSIAAAVGIFSAVVPQMPEASLFLLKIVGGVGIGAGMAMWGQRVIRTLSSGIVAMNPAMCFVAQFASAVVVLSFTYFRMPVSSVHVVVGAVIGVGLVSGVRTIHWNVLYELVSSWIFVMPAAAFVSFFVASGFSLFF